MNELIEDVKEERGPVIPGVVASDRADRLRQAVRVDRGQALPPYGVRVIEIRQRRGGRAGHSWPAVAGSWFETQPGRPEAVCWWATTACGVTVEQLLLSRWSSAP